MTTMRLRRSPGLYRGLGCPRRLDDVGQDWRWPNKKTRTLQ